MRERGYDIAQWTGRVSIMLVLVGAVVTASCQSQPADLPELPVSVPPTRDVAAPAGGKFHPSGLYDLKPSIHSFDDVDLAREDLGPRKDKQTGDDPNIGIIDLPEDPGSGGRNLPSAVISAARPAPEAKVHWGAAIQQSLFLIGIGHTFDLATEAGTRDATFNGPWLNDYLHSVGELRGWSDSDHFMAPYVAHPIQGSPSDSSRARTIQDIEMCNMVAAANTT